MSFWEERFASTEGYVFGTEPSRFLVKHQNRFTSGQKALVIADGEGRNGVWLARQGLDVHSTDLSPSAIRKARSLAHKHGVEMRFEQAELGSWEWPSDAYDVAVGIFIQFSPPEERVKIFTGLKNAVKVGGRIFLHGYTPKQLDYKTGGPSALENLYTEDMLRVSFHDCDILYLESYEDVLEEGSGHVGRSALIDLIVRRRG